MLCWQSTINEKNWRRRCGSPLAKLSSSGWCHSLHHREILFFTWLIQAIACHSILIVSRTADPNLMLRDDPCCQAARHVQPPKPLAGCDRDQLSRQTWKAVVDRMVDTLAGKFFLRGPCVKCITILVSTRTWELQSVSYAFSVPNANSFCVLPGMELRTF